MVVAMANNGMPYSAPPPQPPINSSLPPVNLATQNGAPQDYYENDRLYHGYRKGKYLFPCDENEKDRLDIYHTFFAVARKEKLHSAPITPNYDLRILDLGTGTGIWAIDMADKYFHDRAEVTGLDLVNIQPRQIPPNLAFHIRDIESPWQSLGQDSYDLIHMRMLNGSISDWPDMYEKAFKHLKPGYGWLEHVEIDMQPRCDDGTLPHDSALLLWHGYLMDAMKRADRPMDYNHNTGHLLRQQGFIDVHEEVIPIPFNPWPKDPHQKDWEMVQCGSDGSFGGPLTSTIYKNVSLESA